MRPKRRRLRLLFPAIIVLSGALYLLLPQLFQLPLFQRNIYGFLSQQIPGEMTYREKNLTLFPSPTIHFYDVRLKIDRQFSGNIRDVAATPHFFSLLRGRFNISKLAISGVECTANIPEQDRHISLETIHAGLENKMNTLVDMLGAMKQERFVLSIKKAALTLTRKNEVVFSIQDIGGSVNWQRPALSIDMACKTGLWEKGRLVMDMDAQTRKTSGRLTAENFRATPGTDFLFAGAPLRLEDAALDADIFCETDDFKSWRLAAEASNPDIAFSKDEDRFSLQGKKAAGELYIDGGGIHASILELDLDAPDLRITGRFDLDTSTPHVSWQVDVDTPDLAATRAAALFFAGHFKTTQNIARILRDGGVKELTLGQEARTPDGLKKLPSFHLRGRLDNATIFAPKADLVLTEFFGTVTVSDGILKASDIETRLGNSTGSLGSFTISLHNVKSRPWSVACDLQADLAQLPPLLERITRGSALAREMEGIESTVGSGKGALALYQSDGGLQVEVDVSTFDLSAVYHRIPYPVTLSGGRFSYREGGIQVRDIKGAIGDSRFSGLSGALSWETVPHLSITSASSEVDAAELSDWLGSRFARLRNPGGTPSCTGRLAMENLRFEGPPVNPEEWQFQTDGKVAESLTILKPLFPEDITIHSGRFSATHETIEIEDADASVLDASLFASGSLEGYLDDGPRVLEGLVMGRIGPEISDWVMENASIPEALRWQTPVNLVPVALLWKENEGLDVSGDAALLTGIRLSFDFKRADNELTYGKLDIRHDMRRAAATLTRSGGSLGLRFTGELDRETVSTLLAENPWLAGNLGGDVNIEWEQKLPCLKSVTGHLQADGMDLRPAGLPLTIGHAAITGNGAAVNIKSARFDWKDTGLTASGRMNRTDAGLVMDLDLSADRLDWPGIKTLVETTGSSQNSIRPVLGGNIRFASEHLSLTPSLTFRPFEARLELDGERTDIVFQQADTCGISFPGTLSITPGHIRFDFKPSAEQQDLDPTIGCMKKGDAFIDGRFDLTGDIAFQWDRKGSLWKAVEGTASLKAKNGRIYRGGNIGKLFSMLNVTEILSGQFPDFEKEGFRYETATFGGKFKSGIFELETGVIDGPAMKIFFEGKEKIIDQEHELTIVVAPLKTVDGMIDKIPLLSDVLEKGLVVYPVKVTGDWEDPDLSILSPSAVGGEVLGIMLRTLRTPVTLFEKILPDSKTEPNETTP